MDCSTLIQIRLFLIHSKLLKINFVEIFDYPLQNAHFEINLIAIRLAITFMQFVQKNISDEYILFFVLECIFF